MRLHYGGDFDFFFFFFFSLFSFKFTLGKRVPTSPRRLYHPSLLITVLLYNNMKQLFTHRRAEGSRCCARNDWMCPSLLYLFFFFFFLSPPPLFLFLFLFFVSLRASTSAILRQDTHSSIRPASSRKRSWNRSRIELSPQNSPIRENSISTFR